MSMRRVENPSLVKKKGANKEESELHFADILPVRFHIFPQQTPYITPGFSPSIYYSSTGVIGGHHGRSTDSTNNR